MMKLIEQKGAYDCGAACLAMALGFDDIEQAYDVLGYNPNESIPQGTADAELVLALFAEGYRVLYSTTKEYVINSFGLAPGVATDRKVLPTEAGLREMLKTCTAIVQVPCLSTYTGGHNVVVSEGVIYDPNRTAKYMHLDLLPILGVVFFKEE